MKGYALFTAEPCSRAIEQLQLFAAMNHRREVVFHQACFFARHEARKNQDRLSDPSLANRNAFVRASHSKPIRAGLLQRLGHFRAAVAVAIAFYNGKYLARRFALLLWRVYVPANRLEIVSQRRKRKLRPHRASLYFFVTPLFACHVPSEKFILRHSRVFGLPPATLVAT